MSTLKVNTINAATSGQAVAVDVQNPRSFRNLIINGAMNVDQINGGSAYTGTSAYIIDRWRVLASGVDENPTSNQHALTSSDTGPWAKGFRTSLHVTNGNQTSGAGSSDFISIQQRIENQDIANSGWDYTSTSSYVTLSFWVKSSVAQNFHGYLRTMEGTDQRYAFETGSLSANTWTKITKTIPGDSDLVFNNDNAQGFQINISPFWGDGSTASDVPLNAWSDYSNSTRVPDMTSTWYTTNNSTFEITGVQLEVGDVATDFEHRTFGDELARCQRYYQDSSFGKVGGEATGAGLFMCHPSATSAAFGSAEFAVSMRTRPTVVLYDYAASPGSAAVTQMANANGLAATAANITYTNFSRIDKGSGNFNNTTNQGIVAGFTASAEL